MSAAEVYAAAIRVVTALSEDNLDHGDTFSVLVPRVRIDELRQALERESPDCIARRYRSIAAAAAARKETQ